MLRDADADEALLLDWLRHYGAFIILWIVAGMLAGAAAVAAFDEAEVATFIVDRDAPATTRELGSVAEAVFRSDAAVGPAMRALGIDVAPERFLADSVELRPVPGSRVLIVVGRAASASRAGEISLAMSRSLISALGAAGLQGLAVLSTGTRPGTLSRTTTVAVGGIAGLLVGVGIAIAWYRARRPVLSLRRALRILPAKDVRVVDGRGGWRGALRRRPRPRARALDDPRVAALLPPEGSRAIAVPGIARRAERGVTRRVLRGRSVPAPTSPATLVVIDARTRERDLDLEASQREPEELQMLWVR